MACQRFGRHKSPSRVGELCRRRWGLAGAGPPQEESELGRESRGWELVVWPGKGGRGLGVRACCPELLPGGARRRGIKSHQSLFPN